MRHFSLPTLLGVLLLEAIAFPATATPATNGFRVGFATTDITPPAGWRRAGGYTEFLSQPGGDPLLAKAIVLSEGQTTVAIVGNDLTSVPRELTDRARRRASEETGIPFAHIVITATHTHGGPEYYGPLRDVLHSRALKENNGRDPREPLDYQALLVDRWVAVLAKAHRAAQPAALSVVVPQVHGLAHNRRFLMKDGSTGWNPGKLNPNIFRPLGPTDPDLPFVLVRHTVSGQPLGALTVFAMHTAIYGAPPFGACYPGHLQTALRRQLHAPDFVSIFAEGCAGDINHIEVTSADPQDGDTYPAVVGNKLAEAIAQALPYARAVEPGTLALRSTTIHTPVIPLAPADYAAAKQLMENLDRTDAPFLTTVDAWRKMFQHEYWQKHGGKLPQEIQAIRFDRDTSLVALPHEVHVELGMAIKAASPFRTTIVISLANDLDFYIPPRRAFEEGHYEPTTCPLEPGCGERLAAAAVRLLNELKP